MGSLYFQKHDSGDSHKPDENRLTVEEIKRNKRN